MVRCVLHSGKTNLTVVTSIFKEFFNAVFIGEEACTLPPSILNSFSFHHLSVEYFVESFWEINFVGLFDVFAPLGLKTEFSLRT